MRGVAEGLRAGAALVEGDRVAISTTTPLVELAPGVFLDAARTLSQKNEIVIIIIYSILKLLDEIQNYIINTINYSKID